jgi:hypothetical protein
MRSLSAGSLVYDQLTIYDPSNSFNRAVGLNISDFSLSLFANNVDLNWNLLDGTSVLDQDISSGNVYLNEIVSYPGFYNLRWYPDRIGYWYMSISCSVNGVDYVKEYDLKSANIGYPPGSLIATVL